MFRGSSSRCPARAARFRPRGAGRCSIVVGLRARADDPDRHEQELRTACVEGRHAFVDEVEGDLVASRVNRGRRLEDQPDAVSGPQSARQRRPAVEPGDFVACVVEPAVDQGDAALLECLPGNRTVVGHLDLDPELRACDRRGRNPGGKAYPAGFRTQHLQAAGSGFDRPRRACEFRDAPPQRVGEHLHVGLDEEVAVRAAHEVERHRSRIELPPANLRAAKLQVRIAVALTAEHQRDRARITLADELLVQDQQRRRPAPGREGTRDVERDARRLAVASDDERAPGRSAAISSA